MQNVGFLMPQLICFFPEVLKANYQVDFFCGNQYQANVLSTIFCDTSSRATMVVYFSATCIFASVALAVGV